MKGSQANSLDGAPSTQGQTDRSWWVQNLLRPVLIAAMMVCLAAPPVEILEWMMLGWDGTYLLVFCFFAGLEGILSERVLRKQRITGWAYLGSRGAELLILLLLLKLVNYIPLGLDQLWADAQIWVFNPAHFVTMLDLLTWGLFALLWVGALYVGRQAAELDADEAPIPEPPDKTSSEYYLWLTQPLPVRHRQEALTWLGDAFIWGGIAILLASAVIQFVLPAVGALALPTVLYFALGVALLSQARFSVAHAGWQRQGIAIQRGVARRWLVWAAIFLVGVALVALLLPTRYTMGPLLALLGLFGLLAQVTALIVTLLSYLLALLLSFLLPGAEPPAPPAAALGPMPPAEQQTLAATPPWVEILLSALFWTLILLIVGYAVLVFLQDRFGLLATGQGDEDSWWGRLMAWVRDLWRRWGLWRHGVQDRLARRRAEREGERSVMARLSRVFSLRRLPPRELIRYFYLSAAKRAAQAGQPRRPAQTPYEYQEALDGRFPDLEPDLTGLTDAFVEARYSQRPVQKEDAEAVKPLWQRIKAALRQWRTRD
ncbi:DUF4129 domain-containing protein [Chloroflexota bacterium]